MEFSIGEFSSFTGISIYTLRYYEKEKLIIPTHRKNGRRIYNDNDLRWIAFIKRLKDTNMPIKAIRSYAVLRAQGDDTLTDRMEMLIKHRTVLKEEIMKLQEHLGKLDDKIEYYQTAINNHQKP